MQTLTSRRPRLRRSRRTNPFVKAHAASGSTDPQLSWSDTVRVTHRDTNSAGRGEALDRDVTLDAFRSQLMNDPSGFQEVRVDKVIDLTNLGAFFANIATVPAGGRVRHAALYVIASVTPTNQSHTMQIGIGMNASAPGTFAVLNTLAIGNTKATMVNPSAFASATDVDLCGLLPNGTTITDANITGGKVHVVLTYDTPNALVG